MSGYISDYAQWNQAWLRCFLYSDRPSRLTLTKRRSLQCLIDGIRGHKRFGFTQRNLGFDHNVGVPLR
jgi:hypothetical protein